MEEILASIKRIIAEDGEAVIRPSGRSVGMRQTAPKADVQPHEPEQRESVLELTDPVGFVPSTPESDASALPASPAVHPDDGLISEISVQASRHALDALSNMIVNTPPGIDHNGSGAMTLDSLVVELLRPMLKQWLDQHLPEIVETMVQREIARITGKGV